ncbi:MAG: glycosyltransferase family 87 protein [Polyangiales bacterium]
MISLARRIALTIFCVRIFVIDPLEFLRAKSINDYASFHSAAFAISEGLNPYDFMQLQRAAKAAGLQGANPYFYPPFLAELLIPFTWLEPFPARMVWWAITACAMLASVLLLDRHLASTIEDDTKRDHARTAFIVMCAAMWPIRSSQWMAQVNGIVLLLLVLWWTRRESKAWAGAFLGVAVAIKMSPALLLLVPLWQKRWRESAIAVGTAAGLVLVSCALIGGRGFAFFGDVLAGFAPGHRYHDLRIPIGLAGNHSFAAFAFWMIDHLRTADATHLSPKATLLQLSLITIAFGIWLFRARKVDADAQVTALIMLMILAPTFGFEHHVAFAVLGVALTIKAIVEGRVPRGWAIAAGVSLAILVEHESSFLMPAGQHARIVVALTHQPLLLPLLVIAGAALASRPRLS